MIIVTGPGRSGTSLVAQLYRELGFDPGGPWYPDVRAGLEAPEIVDLNRSIAKYLGMSEFKPHSARRPIGKTLRKSLRRVRKGRLRRPRLDAPVDWERFEPAVERYGERVRKLSGSYPVVKDPRFCQTLRVWAAAGAEIEHVLVCVRSLDAMARSRIAARHTGRSSEDVVRDALVYRLGLCMTALHEFGIEHEVVPFPRFVHSRELLFRAMRFPQPVEFEQFSAAFDRVVRPELASDLPQPTGRAREG